MSFSPPRLSIARKRAMLTKKALAEYCGLAPHTVTRCENGDTIPSSETVERFSEVTGFAKEFFYQADIEQADGASFRSLTSMTASIRDASLAAGAIGFILSDWVEEQFNLPPVNVPDLRHFSPSVAARVLREEWSLGERPVSNMVHLLEANGVRLFSLAENTAAMNAFAIWRNNQPYVFLNTFKSSESSRFDAAHELGHLVLHQDGACVGRQAENEANTFAASFLMPSSDVKAVIPSARYLRQLLQYKKRWKVSLAALAHRLHKLDIISDWRYRDFCIEIANKGYNKKEPFPVERESSVVWQKILRSLWDDGRTVAGVARELFIPEREVNALIFGLIEQKSAGSDELKGSIRLVK